MAKNLALTDKEIVFLKELTHQKVPFLIVGLSAAALQGAPMVTQDVDLWFKDPGHPGIQKALKKVGGFLTPPYNANPPMFAGKSVEDFDLILTVHGIDSFEKESKSAKKIKLGPLTIRVLPLDRIIASKTFLNREKDRMVLPALKSAAKALTKNKT